MGSSYLSSEVVNETTNNVPISTCPALLENCFRFETDRVSAAKRQKRLHVQFSSNLEEVGLQPFVVHRDGADREHRRKLWLGSQARGETRERAAGDDSGAILEWRLVGLFDPVRPDGPVTIRD